jgi:prophage maintenance system killer protein
MKSEYIITKGEITHINKRYGGAVRNDAEIETALEMGRGKNVFRKVALLLKAILVGHPFTDGNKRTALMTAFAVLESCNIMLSGEKKDRMTGEVMKIAGENITDLDRIERLVRYVVTKN